MGKDLVLKIQNLLPLPIRLRRPRQSNEAASELTLQYNAESHFRAVGEGTDQPTLELKLIFDVPSGGKVDADYRFKWDPKASSMRISSLAENMIRLAKDSNLIDSDSNPLFLLVFGEKGGEVFWKITPASLDFIKQARPSLQSLLVLNPLAPVYELDSTGDSNYLPSNLKIWDTSLPKPNTKPDPVCLCLNEGTGDTNGILRVRFEVPEYSKVANIPFIAGGFQGETDFAVMEESQPFIFKAQGNAGYVEVDLKFRSFADIGKVSSKRFIPYGLRSEVASSGESKKQLGFFLKICHTYQYYLLGGVEVEIYIIQRNTAPFFLDFGVPVDFLRLMVLPTLEGQGKNAIDSVEKYIQWTVDRLHRSVISGKLADINEGFAGPIQTYRYDVWDYANRFSYLGLEFRNEGFRLDDWLRYRKDVAPFQTINCYDCASIVLISLSLGIPFKLLQWRFISPFGYLPLEGTSLIGWGQVNNTTGFQNDPSLRIVKSADKAVRTGFCNHAITTVELHPGKAAIALDSCAGPAIGSQDIDGYIANCISGDGGKGKEKRAARYDAQALGFVSDDESGLARPPASWTYDAVYSKRGDFVDHSKKYEDFLKQIANTDLPKYTVDLRRMFPALAQALKDIAGPPDGKESDPKIKSTSKDANVITWKYRDIDFKITICRSPAVAANIFGKLLSSFSADPKSVLVTEVDLKDSGGTLKIQSRSGSDRVAVDGGSKCQEKVKRVALEIENFFKNPQYVEETSVADVGGKEKYAFDLTVKPADDEDLGNLKVRDIAVITVESTHAEEVRAHCRTGAMYQTHKSAKTIVKDTARWTFTFIAQRLGHDVIVFTACHKDSFAGTVHSNFVHAWVKES